MIISFGKDRFLLCSFPICAIFEKEKSRRAENFSVWSRAPGSADGLLTMPQKAPSQKPGIALSRYEKTSHSRGLRKSSKASSSPKLLLSFITQVYKLVLYFYPAAPMFPVHLIMSQPGLSTCSICTFSPAPNFIVTVAAAPLAANASPANLREPDPDSDPSTT